MRKKHPIRPPVVLDLELKGLLQALFYLRTTEMLTLNRALCFISVAMHDGAMTRDIGPILLLKKGATRKAILHLVGLDLIKDGDQKDGHRKLCHLTWQGEALKAKLKLAIKKA
jgi:hypothetical protein